MLVTKSEFAIASVQLKNAQKYFGDTHVIRGVDIDIEDGQFTVLVGPSGCGKSTLLRVIAGLEDLSSGEVFISGAPVNNVLPKERDIAMVFQNYALYPHMTVFDNMAFNLKLAKLDKAKIRERVNATAETLGLTSVLARYPRQLSGGQRQRVAMGRAIVRNPKVFLFDEPLSNLDASLRTQMRTEIKTLHLQLKTTSVYVTHDQIEAMTIADKLVVMRDGNIEQIGSSLDVYDHPDNIFVAGFIGSPSMNFIPGILHRENEKIYVKCSNNISFPLGSEFTGIEGQSIIFGIRPEHLLLQQKEEKFTCFVVLQEPTGAETQLVCRLEQYNLIAVLRERCNFTLGQMITLHFDIKNVHLFDQESGKSLRKA